MYEHGTLKPAEVILRRERWKSKNDKGAEPNWGTLHAHMQMLQ
jgi:hypothetical protein